MICHRIKAANPQLNNQMGAFLEINHHTLVYLQSYWNQSIIPWYTGQVLDVNLPFYHTEYWKNVFKKWELIRSVICCHCLVCSKVPVIWGGHGYAPSMQISTHYKRWITSWYYKNSFPSADPQKGLRDSSQSADHTLRITTLCCCC